MSKRPNKGVSQGDNPNDDHALWRRVAETITPIDRSSSDQDRVRVGGRDDAASLASKQTQLKDRQSHPKKKTTEKKAGLSPTKNELQAPEPKGFGQAETRRLRAGRTQIEARLDLHGMRQAEAHGALRRFLLSSQHKGFRWVLVITGKGGRQTDPEKDQTFDGSGRQADVGVLRRNVPRWLQDPELRPLVIGFQEAAPQHGGEGALYINLRRLDRIKKFRT